MILSVVGARPQFVKAAVVSRALRDAGLEEVLVHTGQHYDVQMSGVFFDELGVPSPYKNLAVGSGSHGHQTARMLERLEEVIVETRPAGVLVYGDTNSTLAAALAAAKLGTPLAHVEAGLRSFRRAMPEEINRVVTDRLSDIHFAPTRTAVDNLSREGISGPCVHLVGDVMLDAAIRFAQSPPGKGDVLSSLGLRPKDYVLATVHRAENTDDANRLAIIFEGLSRAARRTTVVVPLHPRTRERLTSLGLDISRLRIVAPVGYLEMLRLMKCAVVVVTDSGGVQKEASFVQTPCLTLRDETEWVELVTSGWNRLVPPTAARRVEAAVLDAISAPTPTSNPAIELFGAGHASERIAKLLRDVWS